MDTSLIWASIIIFSMLIYIILDGSNLGVGILCTCFQKKNAHDTLIQSIIPVWSGNETWLVFIGAALFSAFPAVYGVVLTALYIPLFLMLICLIIRGASITLRAYAKQFKRYWDTLFMISSIGTCFFQGISAGAWITGLPIINFTYVGTSLDWLTTFNIFCGIHFLIIYAFLGCGYMLCKTQGAIQKKLFFFAMPLYLLCTITSMIMFLLVPRYIPSILKKYQSFEINYFFFFLIILLYFLISLTMYYAVRFKKNKIPFTMGLTTVIFNYTIAIISLWPNIIPPNISIWNVAAPINSQIFSLIGAIISLPIVIIYTIYRYWVFRTIIPINNVTNIIKRNS